MKPEGKGVSDERIDAVLKRLRKIIEPDDDQPHFIVTVRGHGIKLMDGEIIGGEADSA
jgi:DNA-binding winged helix-turn-helix (wHTH) protein